MPRVIALSGVESTGKTTLALMLAGRLRSRGHLVEVLTEPGAGAPFPPTALDQGVEGWAYFVTNHISREIAISCRSNVEWLILDRTPLDFTVYYHARFPDSLVSMALEKLAACWVRRYESVYLLEPKDAVYKEDGHRAPAAQNTWRDKCKGEFLATLAQVVDREKLIRVSAASYRESAEFVYHDILARFFGEARPARAYDQVREWLRQRGWRVEEVRPQGSNSVHRFHAPTDHDDIDAIVIVDGDANYAIQVREDIELHRDHLENVIQASLDLLVTPKGLEAHEM